MGMDITMYISKGEDIIAKNVLGEGFRNSEWFANLMGEGNDDVYKYLSIRGGVSKLAPREIAVEAAALDIFGIRHFTVRDFKKWFEKYNPDVAAGWVRTHTKWKMTRQGYIPDESEVYWELPDDANVADWHFVEYDNIWDGSELLYNWLIEHKVDGDAIVTYWFDN